MSLKREIRKLLENKIKNLPGQKGGPGRGTVVDSNRGDVDIGAGVYTVHTPDDSDEVLCNFNFFYLKNKPLYSTRKFS